METQEIRDRLVEWSEKTAALRAGDITARNRKYELEAELESVLTQLSGIQIAQLKADAEVGVIVNTICEALCIELDAVSGEDDIDVDPSVLLQQWMQRERELRAARHQPLFSREQISNLHAMQARLDALGEALAGKLRQMHDEGDLGEFERSLTDGRELYRVADEVGVHDLFSLDGAAGIQPCFEQLERAQRRLKAAWALQGLDCRLWEDGQQRENDLSRFAEEDGEDAGWAVRVYRNHLRNCEPDDEVRFERAQRSVESVAQRNLSEAITRLRMAILGDQAGYRCMIAELNDELKRLDDCDREYERLRARRDAFRAFVREHVRELDEQLQPQPQLQPAAVAVETAVETDTELEAQIAEQIDQIFRDMNF